MPVKDLTAISFRPVSENRAMLGESPVWWEGNIWWVDVEGCSVFRTDPQTGKTDSWATPEPAGFLVMTSTGRPAIGMQTGIYLLTPEDGSLELLVPLAEPGVRFNDATVDSQGILWAGTMDLALKSPQGRLYRVDADCRSRPVSEGYITLNGLAVDEDAGWLYVSDSHPTVQTIWRFPWDCDTGITGDRTVFRCMDNLKGRPDGATVDRLGNYWIAGVGGGVVHLFSRDGKHRGEIQTPFINPTKPAFGGSGSGLVMLTSKGGEAPDGALALSRLKDGSDPPGPAMPVWRIAR